MTDRIDLDEQLAEEQNGEIDLHDPQLVYQP